MSDFVKRLLDGTPEVTINVDGVNYDSYRLLRREQDYPQDENDGYLVTSGVVPPAGVSTTFNDTTNIKDGVVIYYALFVRDLVTLLYELQETGWVMGLEPNLDEISSNFFPKVLLPTTAVDSTSNPNFFKEGLFDPVFGEIEALIRSLPKQMSVWDADPIVLSNLVRMYNWYPSPHMTLTEFKNHVEDLLPFYRDGKGQAISEMDLFEDISQLPVKIQDWHKNICSADVDDPHHTFEYHIMGVGDGINPTFNYVASWDIIPYTVSITFDGYTYTDKPASLAAGDIVNNLGVSIGTIDYTTGAISVTFDVTPLLGSSIWIYYEFEMQGLDLTDAETQTRYGYWGDRIAYTPSQTKDDEKTGVAVSVYFYLHIEIGEEGIFSFTGPYEKIYVDDILRKKRIAYPIFGDSDFIFVDRHVIAFDEQDYIANLPLEKESDTYGEDEQWPT